MAVTLGIDVSWWQGTIDWAAVARDPAGYRFGICRMTRGSGIADETGRRNLRGILDHLPVAGGYGVVGTADPVGSAKRFVDEVGTVVDPVTVVLMLDAERFAAGTGPSRSQINAYAKQVHADTGRWPLAYVPDWYLDWLATKGDGDGTVRGLELANCPWAPSEYFAAPWNETTLQAHKPTSLHGFKSLGWLQYTSSASVSGISGRVDADVFYGTLNQLRAQLLGQQEVDMPLTDAEIKAINDDWFERYGMRLGQWTAGKENTVYSKVTLGTQGRPASTADTTALAALVQGEGDQTQAAIAALQLGGADPAAIAAAVIAGLGPELAGQLAAELAVRLAQ